MNKDARKIKAIPVIVSPFIASINQWDLVMLQVYKVPKLQLVIGKLSEYHLSRKHCLFLFLSRLLYKCTAMQSILTLHICMNVPNYI